MSLSLFKYTLESKQVPWRNRNDLPLLSSVCMQGALQTGLDVVLLLFHVYGTRLQLLLIKNPP